MCLNCMVFQIHISRGYSWGLNWDVVWNMGLLQLQMDPTQAVLYARGSLQVKLIIQVGFVYFPGWEKKKETKKKKPCLGVRVLDEGVVWISCFHPSFDLNSYNACNMFIVVLCTSLHEIFEWIIGLYKWPDESSLFKSFCILSVPKTLISEIQDQFFF